MDNDRSEAGGDEVVCLRCEPDSLPRGLNSDLELSGSDDDMGDINCWSGEVSQTV